jgi:glycosyltransferase involved in cell wall biosynthesis
MCALRPHVDGLTLIGRLDPGTDAAATPHPLPGDVGVVGLPPYPSAARPLAVLRALPGTVRRLWRALDDLGGVVAFGPSPVALVIVLLAMLRRRKVALGVRQDYPRYVTRRHPDRRGLAAAAFALEGAWRTLARLHPAIVVGPDLARRYRGSAAVFETVISLVDDADVVRSVREPRSPGRAVRLLSVGRLDAEKNPLLLADVLAALVREGGEWRLTVCGEGPLRDALGERLRSLGLGDASDLAGYVPVGPQLRRLYADHDLLVHVSLTEGVPQVLFEAFSSALPVVATAVGGVAAAAGDAALLVPPEDADAVAAAVWRLAGDDGLAASLANRGLERARAHTRQAECRRVAAFLAGSWRTAPLSTTLPS